MINKNLAISFVIAILAFKKRHLNHYYESKTDILKKHLLQQVTVLLAFLYYFFKYLEKKKITH